MIFLPALPIRLAEIAYRCGSLNFPIVKLLSTLTINDLQ